MASFSCVHAPAFSFKVNVHRRTGGSHAIMCALGSHAIMCASGSHAIMCASELVRASMPLCALLLVCASVLMREPQCLWAPQNLYVPQRSCVPRCLCAPGHAFLHPIFPAYVHSARIH
eukprot:1159023-Pelagomonas_calceolata.AAC.4